MSDKTETPRYMLKVQLRALKATVPPSISQGTACNTLAEEQRSTTGALYSFLAPDLLQEKDTSKPEA